MYKWYRHPWRRHQGHLWHSFLRDITEVHLVADVEPDGLDPSLQFPVPVERLPALIAAYAEVRRCHENNGHAVIDAGHLYALNHID